MQLSLLPPPSAFPSLPPPSVFPSLPAACQCNGHSTCVNESVCEECQNNTQGANCEECSDGYFGNAKGGGVCTGETSTRHSYCNHVTLNYCSCDSNWRSCDSHPSPTECFCNDYPASCDKTTGECMCHDVGVTGPSCSVCASNNSYIGDPDNFCYCKYSPHHIHRP